MRNIDLDAMSITGVGVAGIASYLLATHCTEKLVDLWLTDEMTIGDSITGIHQQAIDSYVWGYVQCQNLYFLATCPREVYEEVKNDPI